MKTSILFVDDDLNALNALRRLMRPLHDEFELEFARSGREALATLEHHPFDVVVSDMRMGGMDGGQLLSEVMRLYPRTIRIVFSGCYHKDRVFTAVGPAHQYLAKPSDSGTLKSAVMRSRAIRRLLEDESLKSLVAGIDSLPSLPGLYQELMIEIRSEDASLGKIGKIISRDLGMLTKILQMVNSAFFGLSRQVSKPEEAVSLLGLETIEALVLVVGVFKQFSLPPNSSFSMENLWNHSLQVGTCAKRIARELEEDKSVVESSFLAGLLHDLGKVVIASRLHESAERIHQLAESNDLRGFEAEWRILKGTHAEVGAYLLGLWGFADTLVEALAFHHCPSQCPSDRISPLTTVHLANEIAHHLSGRDGGDLLSKVDEDHLGRVGILDRVGNLETYLESFETS